MNKIKNFVVFNTMIKHGQMNAAEAFYPGIEEANERIKLMREHKEGIAKEVGFTNNNIFMTLQANKNHPYIPGTSYQITREDVDKYEDLYDYDVWADTVKLTPETEEVVVGFNVSDGANVIMMNQNTQEVVSTFCSGAHINKGVPYTIAEALGGNREDMIVDISPFSYTIPFDTTGDTKEPLWISNKFAWEDCLKKKGDFLYIDQKRALLRQLEASGIKYENIHVRENSLFDSNYYSSQRARLQKDNTQDGRFMHAVMYELEGEEKEYTSSYIKKYPVKR